MHKILIVDDDLNVQETIADYFQLKMPDSRIFTAEDGEIALDQINQEKPDLIILDILLPRINGLAFLSDINQMSRAKRIPVICISGAMVEDEDKKLGRKLGAVDYLLKPLDLKQLFEIAKSVLEKK